jgi:SAM-dependent methyltransferase
MDEIYNQKYFKTRSGFPRFFRKLFLYPRIFKLVNPKKGEKILEIGCERGELIKLLNRYTSEVIGIDVNKEAISSAKIKNLFWMNAEKLDFPNAFFDKIVSSHTIEHIPNLNRFFSEIERVLKPAGKCILIYPAEPFRGWAAIANAWDVFRNPFLAGKIHLHRLWPAKLKKITRMKIIKKGIFFRPIALDFYTIFQKAASE